MVDLKQQYAAIKSEVDAAIQEVLDSSAYINGKAVQEFTESLQTYLDCRFVIPCANGTDALQIALMALDLQEGDEVITPSFTFIATAEVIALLKLKPVFVDVDPDTFCMDPAAVEAAITPRTRAIVPVHLFGQCAPMGALMRLAQAHGLHLIEDNAQAIGSTYQLPDGSKRKAGTLGTIGCTSFFPSKNLGAYGDGGALFCQDEALAKRLHMVANHGQSKRYYHDVVGCNSRLDTLQAAVLNVKLRHLDSYIEARRKAADFYDRTLGKISGIITPRRSPESLHVFHQYTLRITDGRRDALKAHLESKSVPAMIYYPVPAHRQQMFAAWDSAKVNLPVTEQLAAEVLSLPMHTELDAEQLTYICQSVTEFMTS